ncbi:F-box protein [Candidatus Berkiella aquae]|uniref:Internalin-J n=1 Tax=Candidatus Berkiella aquae TaxID=295108 RepID=A0A0Q9YLT0_9GAMM|nr:F-box protein [Candidatus Berkiella aquae]MCS5710582.1 hypothetical protein [Candidatus Berkiella aquae]
MKEGSWGDIASLPDELWGAILSKLSAKEMVHFQLASTATNKKGITDAFWRSYLPILANKQHAEIEHFQHHGLIQIRDHYPHIIRNLNEIKQAASSLEEFQKREKLLNDINIALIKSRIFLPGYFETVLHNLYIQPLPHVSLDVSKMGLTRFPKHLFADKDLQNYWKRVVELLCGYNLIISLDLGHLPLLHTLSCPSNQLHTLTLKQCPNLAHLFCDDNQLTSLDVSQSPLLKGVLCRNNRLTSLSLICQLIEYLDFEGSELNFLDLKEDSLLQFSHVSPSQADKTSPVILAKNDDGEEEPKAKKMRP